MPIPLGVLAVAGAGAAGGGAAFELIESVILGTDATVTFSNIPQDYKHLQIRMAARGSYGVEDDYARMTFNTGGSYAGHELIGNGSTVTSVERVGGDYIAWIGGNTMPANVFGAAIVDILDYSNTNKNTTARSLGGVFGNTFKTIRLISFAWFSTAAVTQIQLKNAANGNFKAGSRFSLYGIK